MSVWAIPTVSDFKAKFVRDFPYAPAGDPLNLDFVTDGDIQSGIDEASISFNSGLFGDSASLIFLYLAAHCMICNLINSSKGIGAKANFAQESIGVGQVSISNNIAEKFKNEPMFSGYLKNAYGQKYLELAYPYTIGGVDISDGTTTFA